MKFIKNKEVLDKYSNEIKLFKVGILLFVLELLVMIIMLFLNPVFVMNVFAVCLTGLVGGRMSGISMGLSFNMHPGLVFVILCVFNFTWLIITYPVIILLYEKIIKSRKIEKMVTATSKIASSQKKRIDRYGKVGLFIFVWLPFPWTGSLVGSIIGNLMGLSLKKTMLIVLPAMITGIIAWAFAFERLYLIAGIMGKKEALIISLVLLIFSLFIKIASSRRVKKSVRLNG